MTDIRPLRHRESEAERLLLEAGRSDHPSPSAMQRSAVGLGLGGVLLTSASGAKAVSGGLKGALVKWFVIGGLSVGTGIGAVAVWPDSPTSEGTTLPAAGGTTPAGERTSAGEPAATHQAVGRLRTAEPVRPEALSEGDAQSEADAQSQQATAQVAIKGTREVDEVAPRRAGPTRTKARSPATDAYGKQPVTAKGHIAKEQSVAAAHVVSTLGGEVRLIDAARRALRSGAPASVHKALNEYHAQFPGGTLWQEAQLLRIEAYGQAGHVQKARRLAKSLLAKSPGSAHKKRLESLLGKL